jgi:hypothetical protein
MALARLLLCVHRIPDRSLEAFDQEIATRGDECRMSHRAAILHSRRASRFPSLPRAPGAATKFRPSRPSSRVNAADFLELPRRNFSLHAIARLPMIHVIENGGPPQPDPRMV